MTSAKDSCPVCRRHEGERDEAIDAVAALNDAKLQAEGERDRLREALMSIAGNSCCGPCQEAKMVARAALSPDLIRERKEQEDDRARRDGLPASGPTGSSRSPQPADSNTAPQAVVDALSDYFDRHREDIAWGINDFGDLRGVLAWVDKRPSVPAGATPPDQGAPESAPESSTGDGQGKG